MKCVSIWLPLEAALSILKVCLSVKFYWEVTQIKETAIITESQALIKCLCLKKSIR
jgi:hypothetical protein